MGIEFQGESGEGAEDHLKTLIVALERKEGAAST
jgi:hypothetical protein